MSEKSKVVVETIDDLIAGLKREREKPFTGYTFGAIEVLEIVRLAAIRALED